MKIPVIMYHSVGMNETDWLWSHISMPVALFENQLKLLHRKRFESIDLYEYSALQAKREYKNHKTIVLTFDDGYLDNWVFAYPLLEKYGFKATIFVNPEFVDPAQNVRPNLKDVWEGRCDYSDLKIPGFLSWSELKIMNESGVIDIQSHTMTHTWHFSGSKILDFHHPGAQKKYPWLFWNARPGRKHAYLVENQESFIPYGTPIYENRRALGGKRYFPDQGLANGIVTLAEQRGGEEFFCNESWREILFNQVEKYKTNKNLHDRYEKNEEFKLRTIVELKQCKRILENNLGKKIDFLCWPGGALTEYAVEIAIEVGYKGATLPSSKNNCVSSKNHFWIERMGCGGLFVWKGKTICETGSGLFLRSIANFQGKRTPLLLMRLKKLYYLFRYYLGPN